MSRSVYNVAGKSAIKPENLPDGLTVEETTAPHDPLRVYGTGFTTIIVKESSRYDVPIVNVSFEGLGQTVSRDVSMETAKKVGQWLLDVAESHTKLRKFSDGTSSTSHWYEVAEDRFVWAWSRAEAERLFSANGDRPNYGRNLVNLKDVYGNGIKLVSE